MSKIDKTEGAGLIFTGFALKVANWFYLPFAFQLAYSWHIVPMGAKEISYYQAWCIYTVFCVISSGSLAYLKVDEDKGTLEKAFLSTLLISVMLIMSKCFA